MLKQLLQAYPKDVKVAFKQYPLAFHQYARGAAIAAVIAQRQNKFWEMHDLLFQNQRALDAPSLRRYAETIALDMAAYDKGVSDPEVARVVDQEIQDAQKAGAMGTPTVFVNGVQSPSYALETLKRLVDVTLAGGDLSLEAGKILAEVRAAQARNRTPQPVAPDYNKVYEIDTVGSPSRGPAGAPVTIVVFSDYQ